MKMKSNKKVMLLLSFFAVMILMIAVSNIKTSAPNMEETSSSLFPKINLKTDSELSTTRPTRPPEPKSQKTKSSFDKSTLKKAKELVDKKLEQMNFNGTFLVAVGDEILYHKAWGYSDIDKKIPNTLDTKYEIGSCTKQFTAAAITKLSQQKKLSLEDSVTKYIKTLKIPKEIKIHHLLHMCSGLYDYLNDYINLLEADELDSDSKLSQKELIEWVNNLGTYAKPGEIFSYCNTNYYLMGMIIEKVSGKSYEQYIRDEFFYPLYMDNSSLCMADTDSKGYLDNEWTKGLKVDSSYFYSAGEIVSTTTDMLKWLNAYNSGKVLNKDTFKNATHVGKEGFNYGYGWFVTDDYYYHTGNTELYYAVDIVTRKRDIKIIGLTNINDRKLQQTSLNLMTELQRLLFPQDNVPTEKPTEKPTKAPTEPPTEPPTEVLTEVPTEIPTEVLTEPEISQIPEETTQVTDTSEENTTTETEETHDNSEEW